MSNLTSRQQKIIDFIQETVRERGYPPTVREIGDAVGLTSSSSVHSQLANLEKKGLIKRDPTKPRAIGISADEGPRRAAGSANGAGTKSSGVSVPLVGSIAAGSPTLAAEDVEDYLTVPQGFADDRDHFALHVRGDSMIGAGIFDGDVVVVRRQDNAADGDIVAALLPGPAEDEATVKRLKRDNGRVMLIPENPALTPFEMTGGRILGKVTAVLRQL
jgi:repressor LexA